ncbi:hypothetical protein [Salaquimonas pukyongi]|uniref:hypothetical protein n=1 Tax=Salaquimonas pukyongi TaxID=2712698 RepID=UPI00096BC13E|nr:hypothetical protein [Salaquimonas pukyongi]
MEALLSLISFSNILELPLLVMVPGLLLILLFLARGVRAFLTLRIIRAFTSLVLAFVVTVILSQAGDAIVQLLGLENEPGQQSSITPAFPSDFRYRT